MSLLCVFPQLTADDFSQRLSHLWRALEQESVPSTRLFIEWLILLGLLKHQRPSDLASLRARLLEFSQPAGGAVSVLTIAMHVGCKLEGAAQQTYLRESFDHLLPWLVHNNHMVRLYAIYTYDRLFALYRADSEKSSLPEGYINMAAYLTQSEHNQRFLAKLRREYFLAELDPLADYNIQTIFSKLPQSAGIAHDECISMVS